MRLPFRALPLALAWAAPLVAQVPGLTGTLVVTNKGPATATIIDVASGRTLATLPTGGAKTVTAQYSGDANYLASNATTPHTVTVVTSFSGQTVAPGVTGTVTLTGGGPNCSLANRAKNLSNAPTSRCTSAKRRGAIADTGTTELPANQ